MFVSPLACISYLRMKEFDLEECLPAGGAMVGIVVGAVKGQTTETGFLHGAGIGAVAGAITAVQLLESAADGESLSKVLNINYNIYISISFIDIKFAW